MYDDWWVGGRPACKQLTCGWVGGLPLLPQKYFKLNHLHLGVDLEWLLDRTP